MGTGLAIGLAAAVTLLVLACLGLGAVLARSRRSNQRLTEEMSALRGRLDRLEAAASHAPPERDAPVRSSRPDETEYVITTAGMPALRSSTPAAPRAEVDTRQFVSVALGESMVRLVSLGYGVRRALSAENRNRIGFEVRREIRRARRQRKRELKEARRHLRAAQREEDAA